MSQTVELGDVQSHLSENIISVKISGREIFPIECIKQPNNSV